jgi:hypothetical protein
MCTTDSFHDRSSGHFVLHSGTGSFMKKLSPFISVIFLCCYVPYAILPLTYGVEGPGGLLYRHDHRSTILQELDQNAVDSIQADIAPDRAEKGGSPAPKRVLLRKKRALSVSSKDLLSRPPALFRAQAQDQPVLSLSRMESSLLQGPDGRFGHRSCFSGTAPPASGGVL